MMSIFSKLKPARLPRAVAFVDYEHWYISMETKYRVKPDIAGWVEDMSRTMDVKEIYFFADFSKRGLREEIPKIRGFTNKIIETGSMMTRVQKDFTDFIMLDHIYQEAMSRQDEFDVFVIFTGDGHFYSVVSFLKNICKKTVGIYAVRGALSSQLRLTANWCTEYPNDQEKYAPYFQRLFTYLSDAEAPTFLKTVSDVATGEDAPDEVRAALQWLCENGYVRRFQQTRHGQTVTAIAAEWHNVVRDGLWIPERGAQKVFVRRAMNGNAEKPKPAAKKPAEPAKKPAAKKTAEPVKKPAVPAPEAPAAEAEMNETATPAKKRRRRRRKSAASAVASETPATETVTEVTEVPVPTEPAPSSETDGVPAAPKKRRRRRRRPSAKKTDGIETVSADSEPDSKA